jgi:predicted lipid-binding transport protein (Tim44 family)
MKFLQPFAILLCSLFMIVGLSGCELVGDIFEAGMWTMLIILAIVALLVFWLIRKFTGGRGPGTGV